MNVSTKQQRIAELAKQQPEMSFTSLNHYLDVDWLREAYRRLRKDSAPGYDGQTVADSGKDLETNPLLGQVPSGKWVVKQKTARQRLSRGLKRIAEWCRRNRHLPVAQQHQELCRKLRGHYAYYGLTGNGPWLSKFRQGVRRIWRKWLHRRSRTPSDMPWDRYVRLLERYRLPPIKIVHSVYAAKP